MDFNTVFWLFFARSELKEVTKRKNLAFSLTCGGLILGSLIC